MQSVNSDLQSLLKNIQIGLETYSVKELNDALLKVLSEKQDRQPEINKILLIVSSEYNITKSTLIKSRARGDFQHARMIAYVLLHYTLGMSVRKIGRVFQRGHNCVTTALKRYKSLEPERFKLDKELTDKLKECQKQFFNSINSNNGEKTLQQKG